MGFPHLNVYPRVIGMYRDIIGIVIEINRKLES